MIGVKVRALGCACKYAYIQTHTFLCFASYCLRALFRVIDFLTTATITAMYTVNLILSFFLLPLYLDYLRAATLVTAIIIITVIMRVLAFVSNFFLAYFPIVTVVS